jgi:predicted anti-sigma-YlaC factor YlaD
MDCQTARELILESLAEPRLAATTPELETHLAECEACRSFSETQRTLDLQLSAAITAPPLNPGFRASLAKRVRREPVSAWPDFLPDVAHITGCICATALCLSILPFPPGSVMLAGLGFTLGTWVVQTVLRGSLEEWEEGRQ